MEIIEKIINRYGLNIGLDTGETGKTCVSPVQALSGLGKSKVIQHSIYRRRNCR